MKVKLKNIILYCNSNICEMCNFFDNEANKCNVRVNGELPWHYKRLLNDVLEYPKIAQDIINDVEVEIDENNSKRTD